MEETKTLTELEKAALLKKAGVIQSLLDAGSISLQEIEGTFDPEKSPPGDDWSETRYIGGPHSGGNEGFVNTNNVFRVELSGQHFVLLQKVRRYRNCSTYETDYERSNPDSSGDRETSWFLFRSEGVELDTLRVKRSKLQELLNSAPKHLPEALEALREEGAL